MNAINITVTGNLTGDPELKFTPSGVACATFTVAANERYQQDGQWKDGPTSFMRCNAWRDLAEHVCESLSRGDRVMVSGQLRERSYEVTPAGPNDTGKRRVWELNATDVGAALRNATVKVSRVRRSDGPPPEDPWAGNGDSGNGARQPAPPQDEEPPPF